MLQVVIGWSSELTDHVAELSRWWRNNKKTSGVVAPEGRETGNLSSLERRLKELGGWRGIAPVGAVREKTKATCRKRKADHSSRKRERERWMKQSDSQKYRKAEGKLPTVRGEIGL